MGGGAVVSASFGDGKIAWHENTDGHGTFRSHVITTEAAGAVSVSARDVDGDGDIDVLSASSHDDRLAWYENLGVPLIPGDANRDLRFDQWDIVQVLESAKYLSGNPATWQEGDWNEDGVFDQLDIVAALQGRNYTAD